METKLTPTKEGWTSLGKTLNMVGSDPYGRDWETRIYLGTEKILVGVGVGDNASESDFNARIQSDAMSVYMEKKLTASQLLQQRDELKKIVERLYGLEAWINDSEVKKVLINAFNDAKELLNTIQKHQI